MKFPFVDKHKFDDSCHDFSGAKMLKWTKTKKWSEGLVKKQIGRFEGGRLKKGFTWERWVEFVWDGW